MSTARGAGLTLVGNWSRFGLNILGLAVLSRLLAPADYGLLAVTMVVFNFALLVGDAGLSLVGMQSRHLSQQTASNLFWASTALGFAVSLLGLGMTAPLAAFINNPKLIPVMSLALVAIPLQAMAMQFRVQLSRSGAYGRLAGAEVMAAAAGVGAAIGYAEATRSALALSLQLVAQSSVLLGALVWCARWRPSLPRRGTATGAFRFGSANAGAQFAQFASANIDTVMLGRTVSAATVGLYSRALQLVLMPLQQLVSPLTRVVLPRLARTADTAERDRLLVELQLLIAYGVLSVLGLLWVTCPGLIELMFGEQWSGVTPILRILALASALQTLSYIYYWGLVSTGRSKWLLASELPGRLLVLASVPFAAQSGASAVALCLVAGQLTILSASSTWAARRAGLPQMSLITAGAHGAAFAAAPTAISFALGQGLLGDLVDDSAALQLAIGATIWVAVGALQCLLPPFKRDLLRVRLNLKRLTR